VANPLDSLDQASRAQPTPVQQIVLTVTEVRRAQNRWGWMVGRRSKRIRIGECAPLAAASDKTKDTLVFAKKGPEICNHELLTFWVILHGPG
jgi:hypothetical protein